MQAATESEEIEVVPLVSAIGVLLVVCVVSAKVALRALVPDRLEIIRLRNARVEDTLDENYISLPV